MKKLLLSLSLISLAAHAMEMDEEAPPAAPEQNEPEQNENEIVGEPNKRARSFCIDIATHLKKCFRQTKKVRIVKITLVES